MTPVMAENKQAKPSKTPKRVGVLRNVVQAALHLLSQESTGAALTDIFEGAA